MTDLIVTVELDWADATGAEPAEEGSVLIEARGVGGGGHPVYVVTAPLTTLVSWLVRNYVCPEDEDATLLAENLALALEGATIGAPVA